MSTEMNNIVQRYWSGETTSEEEKLLQTYLLSGQVAEEHQELVELFSFFQDQKAISYPGKLDMDKIYSSSLSPMAVLIDKYMDAESTLEEEQQIRAYLESDKVAAEHLDLIPMFQSFERSGKAKYEGALDKLEQVQSQAVNPKVRYFFPKVVGVAASLALLMMFTFNMLQQDTAYKGYKGKYTEVQDPEEALEMTMDALAFLGKKYDKGTASMKYIKELEKTNVFNFKK